MKQIRMGLFGGEGFVMEHLTGEGYVFLHGSGELVKRSLNDEELIVTRSKVMALDSTIKMNVEFVKTANNIIFSGNGLFNTRLNGTGDVYIQSFSKRGGKDKV